MITYIIGIDPGLNGALASMEFVDNNFTGRIEIIDMPTVCPKKNSTKRKYDIKEIITFLKQFINSGVQSHVYLESVHSMPGQGVASMFSMGEGFGILQGVVTTLNPITFTLISPQSWKKTIVKEKTKDKSISVIIGEKLYPEVELRTKRGRILDGRGDALLIAEYGRTINEYSK